MTLSSSTRRSCLFPALLLVLLMTCMGVIAFTFSTSPASAAIFAPATPTQENHWAYMALPKPAYTATPLPLVVPTVVVPSDVPTTVPSVTEAPAQLMMEMVDTSAQVSSPLQPQAPPSYGGSKLILVDISEQHMYVYDGDTLVYSFVASTGRNNYTKVGTFAVQSKIPNAYGSTWDIWMPDWLGIYYAGGSENGIHALPILPNGATLWSGYLGSPISYGCVVLDTYDAELLYNWADIGTPVKIQW
jgi:lipoprotein-anchoring transpeptidase ErfK/SrfK